MDPHCPHCGGTGFVIAVREGKEFASPCVCRKPAVGGDAFLTSCRIPPRYEHCALATFEPGNPSLSAALEKAIGYCAGYPHLGDYEGLGLLLHGSNGVGKTHLAVSVLRELVTMKGARGQFWDFHGLIREIKSSYDPETKTSELQVLEPVVAVDLLLLDDLGAWKMTDWMNDTLFYILNSRYLAKRATIITTNFQDASLKTIVDAGPQQRKEFFLDRVGPRLRSRLMEMCLSVRMDGGDHREARQESNKTAVFPNPIPPGGR